MNDDLEFFRQRERQELTRAAESEDNSAALAHLRMADAYGARITALVSKEHIGTQGNDEKS